MDPARPPPAGDPEARARSERLAARIADEARALGLLPFDRFVELALYDPSDGYYAQPDLRLGAAGDFYTAAHVHPLFGRTVAHRLLAEYDRLGAPASFTVVEAGAGDGTLAWDLAEALPAGSAGGVLDHHTIVELPGDRRDRLAESLGATGPAFAGSVAEIGPLEGVVLANELLDALPFRRVVRTAGGWAELGVAARGDRLVPETAPLVRPVPPPALPDAPEGTVLEISEAGEAWVREVADHLVAGALIVLDYGREEPELVRAYPSGTVAAVRSHRTLPDPLASPGTADLSAFVNFGRIRAAAARAGLRLLHDRSQAEALGAWGFEDARQRAVDAARTDEERVRVLMASKNLLFGFEGFRVLEFGPAADAR